MTIRRLDWYAEERALRIYLVHSLVITGVLYEINIAHVQMHHLATRTLLAPPTSAALAYLRSIFCTNGRSISHYIAHNALSNRE